MAKGEEGEGHRGRGGGVQGQIFREYRPVEASARRSSDRRHRTNGNRKDPKRQIVYCETLLLWPIHVG